MQRDLLVSQVQQKRSYLCIGLDTDTKKLPAQFSRNAAGVLAFNKRIIDATVDLCVSYKINTAFYEALGPAGFEAMAETVAYIPNTHFTIADAKRGDIGNTSSQYAKAFFETMAFDAITVAPYMGEDSIRPFLEYPGKWTIVLGLTSNKGAEDFELLRVHDNNNQAYLYEKVLEKVSTWGDPGNLMFVTGATQAAAFENIRRIVPDHFLLVPGVGFQGGSLAEVSRYGMNASIGLLVNASRAIIYAASGEDFADEARAIAQQYQTEMSELMPELL